MGAKYGAKFGKKAAQSETGRAAGRAALKAGTEVSNVPVCTRIKETMENLLLTSFDTIYLLHESKPYISIGVPLVGPL